MAFFPNQEVPAGWQPLQELYASHPSLKQDLIRLYTLSGDSDENPNAWSEFEKIFQRVDQFISYRTVFLAYYKHSLEKFAEDGIQFIELRTSFDRILNEDGTYTENEALLALYGNVLQQVKLTYPGFGLTFISCGWRGSSITEVQSQVERTNRLNKAILGMVVGFDLVGEEDAWNSIGYYSTALKMAEIPLFLHGGESIKNSNFNISDAIELHAKRISHSINLFFFPQLERDIVAENILLELCPISNQSLQYVQDIRNHPAIAYLRRGIQASLGSDDPGLFQSQGLTDDYFVAYLSWWLDLVSLKKLILNSIQYSGFSASVKDKYMQQFNQNWDSFIQLVNGG